MSAIPPGLTYEGKLEHVIEQVVLSMQFRKRTSAADIRAALREFSKTVLQYNELEASDALIDEIVGEMVQFHAPRPEEPGWNPDYANSGWSIR